jgi:hypothetical protein
MTFKRVVFSPFTRRLKLVKLLLSYKMVADCQTKRIDMRSFSTSKKQQQKARFVYISFPRAVIKTTTGLCVGAWTVVTPKNMLK